MTFQLSDRSTSRLQSIQVSFKPETAVVAERFDSMYFDVIPSTIFIYDVL